MSISDILSGLGGGINTMANGVGGALFPSDPNLAQYVDPASAGAARNNSLISLGLGIMAAPYSMRGLGAGLLDAYQGAQGNYQGAMDNAFRHTLLKRQADYDQAERDRQLKLNAQQDRQNAAATAQRVLAGLQNPAYADNPGAYLGMAQSDPGFQDMLRQSGIQMPYTGPMADPNQVANFRQQLTNFAGLEGPPPQTIKLSNGDVLGTFSNGSFNQIASAAPKPDYERITRTTADGKTQDYLLDKHTGQINPTGEPYTSTAQQRLNITSGNLADWDPQSLDLAAETYRLTGKLPPNLGRGSPVIPQIFKLAAQKAAAAGDDNTAAVFRQQAVHANRAALDKLAPTVAATKAYSDNLDRNLAQLEPLVNQVDVTGVPVFNRVWNSFRTGAAPTKDTAKFLTYLQDVEAEFAKLKAGSLGNAPISDSQLKEAHQLMLNAFSNNGFAGLKEAIQQTARNKLDSYNGELAVLGQGNGLGRGPAPPTTSSAPTGANGQPLW